VLADDDLARESTRAQRRFEHGAEQLPFERVGADVRIADCSGIDQAAYNERGSERTRA